MKLEEFYIYLDSNPDFVPAFSPRAVMVLDTSGFTKSIENTGIINALRRVRNIHAVAKVAIEDAGGILFKKDADNLFAHFPYVKFAHKAALDIHANLSHRTNMLVSIGIGYGDMIVLEDEVFGLELNYASKLGEDLAGPGELRLTEKALNRLKEEI